MVASAQSRVLSNSTSSPSIPVTSVPTGIYITESSNSNYPATRECSLPSTNANLGGSIKATISSTQFCNGQSSSNLLSCFTFMNIQGLFPQTVPSKVSCVNDILSIDKQLCIGLTDTWLRNHKEAELKIDGYTLFHVDSSRPKKG